MFHEFMFTGIIRTTGIVKEMKSGTLRIVPKGLLRVRAGSSVAVNGVCLTVIHQGVKNSRSRVFHPRFSLMSSTLRTTTLGELKKGDVVNLEFPLRYGDRVDGHFVLGHVDGVGTITETRSLCYRERVSVNPVGRKIRNKEIAVRVPSALKKYCALKGSIALDGVSLTIVSVRGRDVLVSLTPYTLTHTRFANVRAGDKVNVEVDVVARYPIKISKQ